MRAGRVIAAGVACTLLSACVYTQDTGWISLAHWVESREAATGEATQPATDAALVTPASVEGDPTPTEGVRTPEFPVGAAAFSDEARRLYGEGAVARFAQSPVPVIAPLELSDEQREAYAASFRPLPDGFFATLPGEGYDIVVNGTRRFATAPAQAGEVRARDDVTAYDFSESEEGASMSFRRFNSDYTLEFMCHDAVGGEASCVDEDACAAVADTLVLIGGGG